MFAFMAGNEEDENRSAAELDDDYCSSEHSVSHLSCPPPDHCDTTSTVTSLTDDSGVMLPGQQESPSVVGLSDQRVFGRQRPLLELMDRLRSIGLQFDFDLPMIVVVGPQNVGKSSLIEGVCGIKLPRASGTCTRCPIEVRIRRDSRNWRCEVALQIVYDEEGKLLEQAKTIEFGGPIFHPDEVEDRVKRAQYAILTPSAHPKEFLRGTISNHELTFSRNYISIHVQAPNLADLSFVDLPGLVASARNGKVSDISLVEDLVTTYIEKPSTLILLTIACESDFETQSAYQLVKRYDPDGVRTIGVLTKPDRTAAGDENQWVRFIKHEEEELDLGWYSVKQPDASQLHKGLSWNQSRELEIEWFKSTKPWSSLPSKYKKQLGTMNLVEKLGDTLANLIAQRLPELRGDLEDMLQETEEELRKQPTPPSEDSLAEMMRIMTSFCVEVARHVEGIPGSEGLLQSINERQAEFRRRMLSLAPDFRPYTCGESVPQIPPCEFLDGEEVDDKVIDGRLIMYVNEVMNLLRRSRTRELPDFSPYEVTKRIIKKSTAKWNSMVFAYFDEVSVLVSKHIDQLVDKHFKDFESGGLHSLIQSQMKEEILKLRSETHKRLTWVVLVLEQPFTLDTQYLADYKSKFLAYYKLCRSNVLHRDPMTHIQSHSPGHSAAYVGEVTVALNKMGIKDVKALDLAKRLPGDDFEPALNLMAIVSAYFQVSSKRFIDLVPAIVDYDFVRGLSRNLQITLYSTIIKGNSQSRCRNLLQESRSVAMRRSKLQRKYESLETAKEELLSMHWKGIW